MHIIDYTIYGLSEQTDHTAPCHEAGKLISISSEIHWDRLTSRMNVSIKRNHICFPRFSVEGWVSFGLWQSESVRSKRGSGVVKACTAAYFAPSLPSWQPISFAVEKAKAPQGFHSGGSEFSCSYLQISECRLAALAFISRQTFFSELETMLGTPSFVIT